MSGMKNYWTAKVECSKGVLDLYSAELHECHRILDTLGVPQSGFEEQLTISQRLGMLAVQYRHLQDWKTQHRA